MSSSQGASGECYPMICHRGKLSITISRKWKADDTWLLIHQSLHEQTRRDGGKEPSPTVAIIDSQSVKTTELATTRGFDGHKKVKGRKRISPIVIG